MRAISLVSVSTWLMHCLSGGRSEKTQRRSLLQDDIKRLQWRAVVR